MRKDNEKDVDPVKGQQEVEDLTERDGGGRGEQEKKRKRSRKRVAAAALLLLVIGAGFLLWSALGSGNSAKINLRVRNQQSQDKSAGGDQSPKAAEPDDMTAEAIAEARRAIAQSSPAQQPAPDSGKDASRSSTVPPSPGLHSSVLAPPPDLSGTVASSGGQQPGSDEKLEGGKSGDEAAPTQSHSQSASRVASRRNAEQSIRFVDTDQVSPKPQRPSFVKTNAPAKDGRDKAAADSTAQPDRPRFTSKSAAAPQITLPDFGSILPVRTLGTIFTLRSGSLTRLELTRDVGGDGWALAKRTVLIGTVRGGEQDRAFIALVGLIDPQTNRFVKLTGELLGGDGGSGLKGKRHRLSSGWSRAFSRIGSSAVQVAGAIAGSRISGQPIIITDVGTRTINPFTSEVDAVLLDRSTSRGFVEVTAGTPGFVMVTDLPAEIKGVDALPELSPDRLARLSDTQAARPATGLSEEELAALLTSGDPEDIRAALPRMTPQMRKLAQTVLAESER
ncbi:MAG TPA: hypothetical protein VNO14_18585 [Blastocatellia bacterium]|nr:hypothetical protein [Blastocatellia bacterium]